MATHLPTICSGLIRDLIRYVRLTFVERYRFVYSTDAPKVPTTDVIHVYGALGDNITLTCTMAALPFEDVSFDWWHTGENGTHFLKTSEGDFISEESVTANITIPDLDRYSYGIVNCTGSNNIGTGQTQTYHIYQRGESVIIALHVV